MKKLNILFLLQTCKWCSNGSRGTCIDSHSDECSPSERRATVDVADCPERQCLASDCDRCRVRDNCVWTRQVLLTSELGLTLTGEPVYDWSCVSISVRARSSLSVNSSPTCPKRCAEHKHCDACLRSHGAEGGWHECRWSTQLHEVIW